MIAILPFIFLLFVSINNESIYVTIKLFNKAEQMMNDDAIKSVACHVPIKMLLCTGDLNYFISNANAANKIKNSHFTLHGSH